MFKHSATDANKFPEPPQIHPGGPPDSERAKQPPLPEAIYEPYAQKTALHDAPYKPYSQKTALPEPPYEPYKGM